MNNYLWLKGFQCSKAESLQKYLKEDAIRADTHHETRTYVIFDDEAYMIVAYFSIRTTCMIRRVIETEEKEKIVKNIIPCIELTKFCINEKYLDFLKNNGYDNNGIGKYTYNMFVVPTIVVLSSIVGFTEVILFAIQDKKNKVIEAYRQHMGFETIEDDDAKVISTLDDTALIVDEYSSECKFMYQDVDEIIRKYEGGYQYA